MSVILKASGGGSVTLQEPSTASDYTLSLPATTGTVITTATPQSGSIIQVAQYLNYTYASTTNSSFTATGYAVTITPKFSTSTMLVRCAISGSQSQSNGAGYFTVYKNGSNLAGDNGYGTLYTNASYSNPFRVGIAIELTNAAGGSGAITYEIYFKTNTVGTVALNQDSTATSITVMEIAA
jgi:hypothetical protein